MYRFGCLPRRKVRGFSCAITPVRRAVKLLYRLRLSRGDRGSQIADCRTSGDGGSGSRVGMLGHK